MKQTVNRLALMGLLSLSMAACVQRAPFLEGQMGQSVNMIKAQQLVNPQASSNTDPVAGMDAKAAQSAQGRYEQSFKTQAPQRGAFTIGISRGQ